MRRQDIVAIAFGALATLAFAPAMANTIVIEPDAFAAGTDVSHAVDGVTLSSQQSYVRPGQPGLTGPAYSTFGPPNGEGGYFAPTGQRVFGPSPTTFGFAYPSGASVGAPALRIDFAVSASAIEFLWMDPGETWFSPSSGQGGFGGGLVVEAYDSASHFLGSCSGSFGRSYGGCASEFRGMLDPYVTRPDGVQCCTGAFSTSFDVSSLGNVSFLVAGGVVIDRIGVSVPEPATFALLGTGL